jgi:tRNA U34 5-carboxymethylaminomethyl modifying enzyme MnmG/GidA
MEMNFTQEIKDKEYLHSIEIDDLKDMHSQEITNLKTEYQEQVNISIKYKQSILRWKKNL